MSISLLKPKILVILGPTASGKSALAVKVAKKYKGEIISADSRQVYRGLDIGSGKITKKEMRGVPHYLLSIMSPQRTFTAAYFQKLGSKAIRKILRKGKLPIIVGGTGFYIDTLIRGYALPQVKPNLKLRKTLESKTAAELFLKLKKLDPKRAENIDSKNKRRLIRALEIILATGKSIPILNQKSPYEVLKIGIGLPTETLKKNIERRLRARLRGGMLREVEQLRKNGVSYKRLDALGLEYRYVSRYLQGLITKEEMIEVLKREIWRYAKRQKLWFKRNKEIIWTQKPEATLKYVRKFLT